jgi:hypothetical protein
MKILVALQQSGEGFATLAKRAAELKRLNLVAKVGVMSEETHERTSGLSVAQLAAIHEFGAPRANIPERSYIRSTYHAEQDALRQMARTLVQRVLMGKMEAEQALNLLGMKLANAIKRAITTGDGIPPPLSPDTIRRKGSSRPLVDTGRLLGAITWKVAPHERGA